jgi:DMSO/TMAO reductase YedYZ heme-binding membrane subunit
VILAATNAKALWYATRGTGVVALLLLTASVVLGALSSARWQSRRTPRFLVGGLHRNLTLLAVVFVVAHVVTTVLDGFAPIRLIDGLVPFVSPYRPIWLGLGAVAFDLLLALIVTSLIRARLGLRIWRAVHWLAYASWPVAVVHALGTGSDARFGWMVLVGFGSCAAVVAAILIRIARGAADRVERTAAIGATLAVPIALFVWYFGGPNRVGWAARAGTPAALVPPHRAVTQPVATATQALPRETFDARLTGRLQESGPRADGLITITIHGRVRGSVRGALRITLWGAPAEDGGVALTASDVAFGANGTTLPYVGQVVSLDGNRVAADLATSSGARLALAVTLRLDRQTSAVGGDVQGQAS